MLDLARIWRPLKQSQSAKWTHLNAAVRGHDDRYWIGADDRSTQAQGTYRDTDEQ